MNTQTATRNIHYVLSTHWDREWHQTFQDFRYRLVRMMDEILEGLESGRLKGPFQTDGQAIVLEDYLEIRPERADQLRRLVSEGKLVVGPWYVLPDEFLVSGESHIRNIRFGRQVAREFGGKPSQAGFVCDLFGHISQMPQIMKGFGIEVGFAWRGINLHHKRHFIWVGADGTEMLMYRFDNIGYCDYSFRVRQAHKPDVAFDAARTRADLDAYLNFEASETETDAVLIFDGGDHQEWDQHVYDVLVERMSAEDDKYTVRHSSLDAYIEDISTQRDRVTTRLEGELRDPGKKPHKATHLIHGVLSSRVWIKQWNARCQTLLCHWAEPMSYFAKRALGFEQAPGYLRSAWRWLLMNHPHDSICGCSVDQVHEDMKYRFAQAEQIGERLTAESLRRLAASIGEVVGDDELRVVLFNPLPVEIDQAVEVDLQIPAEWPTFGEFFFFETKPAFRVYNAGGEELPYQRVAQAQNRHQTRLFENKFPHGYKVTKVRVSLPVQIPGLGYTTLIVRKGEAGVPTRHPQNTPIVRGERTLENEHLVVRAEGNGTLTLTDKRSGQQYTELLTFEESCDIGDGWFHGPAVNDQTYYSTGAVSDIAVLENGPLVGALRIRTTMRVPEEFEFQPLMQRSERRVEMVIDSVVRLRTGADYIEVETTVHNNAKDHRVRVFFPSNADATTYLSDTPFDVVERRIGLREDNHEYVELEVETKPQQNWTAVFDEVRGLAVIAPGLLETAVRDTRERTLALTLFRGTRRTVETDGQPGGQLLGELRFRYLLAPLCGEPDRTRLFLLAQQCAAGVRDVQLRAADQAICRQEEKLPPTAGMVQLDGGAVLTSAREVESGLEVRVFNPHDTSVDVVVATEADGKVFPPFERAELVDFESHATGSPLKLQAGSVAIALSAKAIATVRFS